MVGIAYLTLSRLPGTAANAIQVMKMAQAMLEWDAQLLMTAVRGSDQAPLERQLFAMYGISRMPKNLRFWPVSGRFGVHTYNIRASWTAWRAGARLVLTRSVGAAAFCARMGIPTIWECHAPPSGMEHRIWCWLTRAKGFRRLVVVSQALADIMIGRYPWLKGMDVVVAHDGVDMDRFAGLPTADQAKSTAGRDVARPVAGYAGHLYPGRGIDIITACAEALPHWDFLIAGGTPEAVHELRQSLGRRQLQNVQLLGFVENSRLPELMAVCDVLLMPYQRNVLVAGGRLDTAAWMSPLKMFEYMAMGRAIIASDLPVLKEVLSSDTAYLVAPDSITEWVEALRALEVSSLRENLAKIASEKVMTYDWRRRVELILNGLYSPSGPFA